MLLDTELIRTFVAIAETGSFSRAADIVHRTPSAVSMQIKRLEELLERSLFHREARSVRLTGDGEALLGYGRRLLSLNDEAVARFKSPPLDGLITLGSPDDFGVRFLPNILARFAASHPDVDVDVVLAPSSQLERRLKSGGIDLALMTADPRGPSKDTSELIRTEPLIWVGLKGGKAFARDRLPLALAAPGCAWRDMALRALDEAGRDYRIAYTCEQGIGQMAAVMADLAIAPLPASLIDQRLERLGTKQHLPHVGAYQVILKQKDGRDPIGDALADHVRASFGRMPPFTSHIT